MCCRRVLDIAHAVKFDVKIERESPTIISELPRQPMSIVWFHPFAAGRSFTILQLRQRFSTTPATSLPPPPTPIFRKLRLSAVREATIRKFRMTRSKDSG